MSMNGLVKGFRGGNVRNGKTQFPQYEARKARADVRKAVSDARTPEEQLKNLDRAGLTAVKERLKLAKRIRARDEKVAPVEGKKSKNAKGQASGSPATSK